MTDTTTIDGFGPVPVRRADTPAAAAAFVREAAAAGQAVYPVGGRTLLGIGVPPTKPGVAIDTTALNRVVDYPARDMTITVEAGVTVAVLAKVLAAENQWLPVDVPHPEKATLGGVVAANVSGPRRLGYGTFRDYLLGLSFIADDGADVKAGGRVVKNVAGYDLMKLHTGAVGTLGLMTQFTFKVRPRPEDSAFLARGVKASEVAAVLDRLHASMSRPIAVELLNRAAVVAAGIADVLPAADWVILAGFEEKAVTVTWMLTALRAEWAGETVELRGDAATRVWATLAGLPSATTEPFVWKLSVPPGGVAAAVAGLPGAVHAHAMTGVVWVHTTAESLPAPKTGAVTMRHGPAGAKTAARVWGPPRGDAVLMRHVKQTLDPHDVFNPGRLFG